MATSSVRVTRTGHAVIQDLGRPGYAEIGIPANGAADQHSARTASILVANPETAPLIEITGSELSLVPDDDVLLAVTGAAEHVLVDGHRQPAWQTVHVHRGAHVSIPPGPQGLRSYLAISGSLDCDLALGSVAPDPLLGVGRTLRTGDRLAVQTRYDPSSYRGHHAPMFAFSVPRPALGGRTVIDAVPGPERDRMTRGASCLSSRYEVSAQSDHIGLRLLGPPVEQSTTAVLLSRGVPVGAIEVTPSGGVIVLLRGRLVTAGYPVVGVVASASLDRLGQLRPGDAVEFAFCDAETARLRFRRRHEERQELAAKVRTAFAAAGFAALLGSEVTATQLTVAAGQA